MKVAAFARICVFETSVIHRTFLNLSRCGKPPTLHTKISGNIGSNRLHTPQAFTCRDNRMCVSSWKFHLVRNLHAPRPRSCVTSRVRYKRRQGELHGLKDLFNFLVNAHCLCDEFLVSGSELWDTIKYTNCAFRCKYSNYSPVGHDIVWCRWIQRIWKDR
jgi:hypothetical protein